MPTQKLTKSVSYILCLLVFISFISPSLVFADERQSMSDPPVNLGRAAGTAIASVTVLVTQMQYGVGGEDADMPVRLKYQIGLDDPQPLFDGFDVDYTRTDRFNIVWTSRRDGTGQTRGGMESSLKDTGGASLAPPTIAFYARTAMPNFLNVPPEYPDPEYTNEIKSDDTVDAVVLKDGDNFYDVAADKGIQPVYPGQYSLPTILSYYNIMDIDGNISLGYYEEVILFELGDHASGAEEARDFQDAVIKVRYHWGTLPTMVAENQIGPGGMYADGLPSFDAFFIGDGSAGLFALPVTIFTAPRSGRVKKVTAIASTKFYDPYVGPCNQTFTDPMEGRVHFWSSVENYFAGEGRTGEVVADFEDPTNSEYKRVVGYHDDGDHVFPKYKIEFEIGEYMEVVEGQNYVIGVNASEHVIGDQGCEMLVSYSTGEGEGNGISDAIAAYNFPPAYLEDLWDDWDQFAIKVEVGP